MSYFIEDSKDVSILKAYWVNHGEQIDLMDSVKRGVSRGISCIDIHPDNTRFVTSGGDNKIKIWNMGSIINKDWEIDMKHPMNKLLCVLCENNQNTINCCKFSKNGVYLASGDSKGNIKIWTIDSISNDIDEEIKDAGVGVGSGKVGGGSNAGNGGNLVNEIYYSEKWIKYQTLSTNEWCNIEDIQWNHNDKYIASTYVNPRSNDVNENGGHIIIWGWNQSKKLCKIKKIRAHDDWIMGLSWDPLGTVLVSQVCIHILSYIDIYILWILCVIRQFDPAVCILIYIHIFVHIY